MSQTSKENEQSDSTLDFSELILGFSSAALYHMGFVAVEGQVSEKKNLMLASQNIEIIRMLKEKTKGNLSKEEKQLITEVLADLEEKYKHAKG